jgi:ParB family chromosome partitioning protein
MHQHIISKRLDISRINFDDFSYSISPDREFYPDKLLRESIARNGIIHPPIVKETISGSYVIVSGRKRLGAFRAVFPEEKMCLCMILSGGISDADVFSVLLEEIITRRQLSPIEKALFLKKISSLVDEKQIVQEFLTRMGLPRDPVQIKHGKMLLDLEDILIHALHRGDLPETMAREIMPLSADDRLAVYGVISALHLGINYQKKLLTICRDLAGREGRSIASLLNDKEVREILNHRDANPPQKTKNLMNHLVRRYTPKSSQAEEEFNRFVASLHLPPNISVKHTPSFEDDSLTLAITLSDKKTLQELLNIIKDATRNPDN